MGVRSLGNVLASYGYKFGTTGIEANAVPPPTPVSASGGIISDYGTYRAHIFTSSGTFDVDSGPITADILIVGAGGGGGYGREGNGFNETGGVGYNGGGHGGNSPQETSPGGSNATGYGSGGGGHGYHAPGGCGSSGSGYKGIVIISYSN